MFSEFTMGPQYNAEMLPSPGQLHSTSLKKDMVGKFNTVMHDSVSERNTNKPITGSHT